MQIAGTQVFQAECKSFEMGGALGYKRIIKASAIGVK